jgi:hypothetical protein
MHTNRTCFILYYFSTTCFGRFYDHLHCTAHYKKYIKNCKKCPPDIAANSLRVPCGYKMSNYVIVKKQIKVGVFMLLLCCI